MDKTRINLDILLPQVPDARDACVHRIIQSLEEKKGIDKVHLLQKDGNASAQLCFHYDSNVISVADIENKARDAGAAITQQYGHLLIEVKGIRHQRHARVVEAELKDIDGIVSVSVSGTGFIKVEFDKMQTSESYITAAVRKSGMEILSVKDFHQHDEENGMISPDGHDHGQDTHQKDDKHDHDHDHLHGGIWGEKTELIFAIICGILLGLGFALSFVNTLPSWVSLGLYCGAYFFGGFYTTKEAIEGISKGDFEIDFLMLVAAIGAAVLGQWAEGALLLFLFSLGHSLEHYAMEKARKSIAALAEIAPKTALLQTGNTLKEVSIEELKQGNIIVIKPNTKIAADGLVVGGNSSVNQAPITGESVPVDKWAMTETSVPVDKAENADAQHRVFAGSINGSGTLTIKVTRIAADSTIARLVKLVNEAQTQKSPTQNFTDKLERYYVPAVLISVALLLFAFLVIDEPFSQSFYRAMSVLVAASPCALAISTPSAVLSGVARAARGGVLVKGGRPLEELGSLRAIAFDKTGTLTIGKPTLTGVYAFEGFTEIDLLTMASAVEKLSDHPLAMAIVKGSSDRLKKEISPASNLTATTGRGIQAMYEGSTIFIGNKEMFEEGIHTLPDKIKQQVIEKEKEGNTTMLVKKNDTFAGMLTLMDKARSDAKETLAQLKSAGIRKMIMLTGDNQNVADAIAKETGITDAWGNLLPEQKVEAIEKLKKSEKKVAMVGDGVNDAPAMAKSTVGIAMGAAGSDVALETADIALMADELSNLPFAIGLSRKAHQIIRQNIIISLGMVAILVPLTLLGIAHMGPAVIGHEGSTLVVVFNALRLLAYKKR